MKFNKATEAFNNYLEDYREKNLKGNLLKPVKYILSLGGKRLRPALLVWINQLFNGDINEALNGALAIEMFHNFSLVHDDIMDEAPLRRGKESVHQKWGTNTAILSGDAMLILVYQILENIEPEHFQRAISLLNRSALNVCRGQQLDMDFESKRIIDIDQYIEMIGQKTGDLLGASFSMGALLANASEKDIENLYEFGKKTGIAFQIQDDILDLFGDKSKVGKQVGGDIISNKKTYLWIMAFEKADEKMQSRLINMESEINPTLKVEMAQKLFHELGVKTDAENEKKKFQNEALGLLDELDLAKEKREMIGQLTLGLLSREA